MPNTKVVGFMQCIHCSQLGYIFVGDPQSGAVEIYAVVSKHGAMRVLDRVLTQVSVSHNYAQIIQKTIRLSRLPENDPIISINLETRAAHKALLEDAETLVTGVVNMMARVYRVQSTARWN